MSEGARKGEGGEEAGRVGGVSSRHWPFVRVSFQMAVVVEEQVTLGAAKKSPHLPKALAALLVISGL